MQVKIFESPDMATGLKMIRRELGPDAMILSTRTIRNGKLGLLGKPVLEITAAVDNRAPEPQPPPSPVFGNPLRRTAQRAYEQHSTTVDQPPASDAPTVALEKKRAPWFTPPPLQPQVEVNNVGVTEQAAMAQELNALKEMVAGLSGEISRMATQPPPQSPPAAAAPDPAPAGRDPLVNYLSGHGVAPENCATIAAFAKESLSFADLSRPAVYQSFLRRAIADFLPIAPLDLSPQGGKRRLALVGPTGVGKTTTLAKLAAAFLAAGSGSIALITIDTYRIAAVEQLKVYGEIMRVPVEVVISPAHLQAALEKHRERDLILIDTAGRSPRDAISIEELASFLAVDATVEKHLVLSAVARESELLETVERFRPVGIDRTIFTKIDECGSLGVLLNVQIRNPAPLSCLTNGQRVPEDLLLIDHETLSGLILPPGEGSQS
ncbi:flagellar biosynthesis protein FlhF [Desulfofustis limnaeus]|uniref:Flagellar biosynthesis protein FlhF n=1 Tax=Desulfofustis limnaeus TaxID=2740163 RepID=A0ABM7W8P8_9BACT|nr:flagellar biosynthesis protein FlhF [Desulfofustis limnaeus]BDD87349.1 flagellar biosynthesis protein FlhF [Desulfofustis limnaeus]